MKTNFGKMREVFEEEIMPVTKSSQISKIPLHIIIIYLERT
jgi:hypothetical protein